MRGMHLTVEGNWEGCDEVTAACGRAIHVPSMTAEDVPHVPYAVLLSLLEAVDPPTHVSEQEDIKAWRDGHGSLHREYGLPAFIRGTGYMGWFTHGKWQRSVGA